MGVFRPECAVARGRLRPERPRELHQVLHAPAASETPHDPHPLEVEEHAAHRLRRPLDEHVHVLQVVVVHAGGVQAAEEVAEGMGDGAAAGAPPRSRLLEDHRHLRTADPLPLAFA